MKKLVCIWLVSLMVFNGCAGLVPLVYTNYEIHQFKTTKPIEVKRYKDLALMKKQLKLQNDVYAVFYKKERKTKWHTMKGALKKFEVLKKKYYGEGDNGENTMETKNY